MWEKLKQAPAIISMVIALFQAIRDLTIVAEEDGPEKGGGAEKKNLILQVIEVIYDLLDHWIDLPIEKKIIMDAANKLIEIVVNFFNLIGVFRKSEEDKEEEDYKAEFVVVDESPTWQERMEKR